MKKIFEDFFFWRTLAAVSWVLGLGLKHSCPWPREGLSSKRLSLALALASDFLCPWPRALCPPLHLCYPFRKCNLSGSNSLKVQHFGKPDLGESPKPGTPDFSRTLVLPDIFNSSNFEYRAFSGLTVDSGRRKKKKKKVRKQMQNQKNSFQVGVNENN